MITIGALIKCGPVALNHHIFYKNNHFELLGASVSISQTLLVQRTYDVLFIQSFQQQSNLLFTILSSVRSHNTSSHLAQLLLRLDYNRYYSVVGGQLGR